jgi:two-component sensor histidine kinase
MSNRINASGPPVRLASAQAVALAMALHELCTNAVKYGALSNEAGRIDIVWNLNGRNGMRLQWRESGGPPVAPDPKRGFGTRFIEASFRADPNQSVRLEFAPAGVVCIIELPFATASRDDLLTEIGSGGPDPSPG